MNVYIVTRGKYSDYEIQRVFSDKEKAERYASGIYEANDVECWNVDEEYSGFFTVITFWMRFDKEGNPIECCSNDPPFYNLSRETQNTLDNSFGEKDETAYRAKIETCDIIVTRSINKEDITPEELLRLKEKYKKVMFDLYSQIQSLKQVEGWNGEMINAWLKKKYRNKGGIK